MDDLLQPTLQLMPVTEVFNGLIDFYRLHLFPIWTEIKAETDPVIKVDLLRKIYNATKDNDLDNIQFVWREYTIEGNDGKKCVVGTVLDVTDENSRIYDCYKRFTAGLKYYIYAYSGLNVEDIRTAWTPYLGTYYFTEAGAMQMIDEAIYEATMEDGIFDEILLLAENNQWKI